MSFHSPKLWLALIALSLPVALYLAFSTDAAGNGGGGGDAGTMVRSIESPTAREDLVAPTPSQATSIEIPAEAKLEIELTLEKVGELDRSADALPFRGAFHGIVRGRVFDGDGSGLHGALVEVSGGPSLGRAVSSGIDGRFRIEGLAPGYAALRFSTPSTAAVTRRVQIPAQKEAEIEVVLTRGVPFFGKVIGFDGKGIAGATVEIEDRSTSTNGAGEWSFDEVPSGNDIVVYARAEGYALQRMQALVPIELPSEDWAGLVVQLMRGAALQVQPEGFPLTAPLSVSIIPREGYANPNFPAERFIDLKAPVDGSALVVAGLPQSFLGQVLVAHPIVGAERSVFPLVIGSSDPMPIRVSANPSQSMRAHGRVLAAPSGGAAGLADVLVHVEPADLDAYLQNFNGGAGELWPLPSFAWLHAETVSREQGRFELELSFPPPWRASAQRDGFALAQAVFGPADDLELRLTPLEAQVGEIEVLIDPARPALLRWRLAGAEAAFHPQELAADESADLGDFEAGIYRVQRRMQGHELTPLELRVMPGRTVKIELGWGRQ